MKKLGICLCLCIFIFWAGRIYSMNSVYDDNEVIYGSDDSIEISDISVIQKEAHIYSSHKFSSLYAEAEAMMDSGYLPESDRVICVCLMVTNISSRALEWDEVMLSLQCGFESLTWGCSVDPSITAVMNMFYTEKLEPGQCQNIWFAADMSPLSFKRKHWNNLGEMDMYYVFSLSPERMKMKLNIDSVQME